MINENLITYIQSNLSPDAKLAADKDASLIMALHKAQLWDESQSKKGTRKLQKKTKSLNAGDGKVNNQKSAKEQEKAKRVASGRASKEEAEAGIQDLANNMLFG